MLFMNRPPPIDFSYTRSDSSGTSIPAEPAERVVREYPCPMVSMALHLTGVERWMVVVIIHIRTSSNMVTLMDSVTRSTGIIEPTTPVIVES